MKKILFFAVSILFAASSLLATAQDKKTSRALTVKVHYMGSGTVDEKHPIHVFLFDSPDFVRGGGSPPFAHQTITSKNGTVVFADTAKSPLYASAVYDPAGGYDGQSGPPPSGASLGLYSKTPGDPAPVSVDPGSNISIDLPFDDTVKMP